MSIRRSLTAVTLAASLGTFAAGAAEPGKGAAGPAGGAGQAGHQPATPATPNQPAAAAGGNNAGTNNGPANNAPANNANGSGNAGRENNTPGGRGEGERNGKGENGADRRGERRGRIVYVPGYGYTNWMGDYSTPYWSASGAWYTGQDFPAAQQPGTDNGGAAPRPSNRPQEEAAQAEMTSARARLAKEFETKEDVRDALRDVQEAQRAYDTAVATASKDLKNDPAYEKAEAEKQKAARKVEAVQAADRQAVPGATATQPAPISPEVVRAAQQKLNAASKESAIAADRAQADPAVVAAREKLEAAADRLNGMKDKFDAALQGDPQWLAAKQKLDAARATPQ